MYFRSINIELNPSHGNFLIHCVETVYLLGTSRQVLFSLEEEEGY